VGVRRLGGRAFEVVEVQPWGGLPRELWFDQRTHLLARMIDRSGPAPVVYAVSDYRRSGAVLVPFRIAPEPGSPASAQPR
jgi:hypothetical protein